MGTLSRTVIGFVSVALLVACGGDERPAAKKANKPARKPMLVAEATPEPEVAYRYDPEGKPDPFRSFIRREPELEGVPAETPLGVDDDLCTRVGGRVPEQGLTEHADPGEDALRTRQPVARARERAQKRGHRGQLRAAQEQRERRRSPEARDPAPVLGPRSTPGPDRTHPGGISERLRPVQATPSLTR